MNFDLFRMTSLLIDSNLTGIRQLANMIETNVNKTIRNYKAVSWRYGFLKMSNPKLTLHEKLLLQNGFLLSIPLNFSIKKWCALIPTSCSLKKNGGNFVVLPQLFPFASIASFNFSLSFAVEHNGKMGYWKSRI